MNDSKFIELLNLFLDHEITAADAQLLEAEVQRNPARRRLYREYCEMQKACVLLAEQAQPSTLPESVRTETVVADRWWSPATWGFGTYASGLCAAAACLALVAVLRNGNGSMVAASKAPSPAVIANVQIDTQPNRLETRREMPMTVSLGSRTSDLHPVFTTQSLALTKQHRDTVPAATTDPRFEWMNRVQVTSLQKPKADELLFEATSSLQTDASTFRSRPSGEGSFTKAAFQFQR